MPAHTSVPRPARTTEHTTSSTCRSSNKKKRSICPPSPQPPSGCSPRAKHTPGRPQLSSTTDERPSTPKRLLGWTSSTTSQTPSDGLTTSSHEPSSKGPDRPDNAAPQARRNVTPIKRATAPPSQEARHAANRPAGRGRPRFSGRPIRSPRKRVPRRRRADRLCERFSLSLRAFCAHVDERSVLTRSGAHVLLASGYFGRGAERQV